MANTKTGLNYFTIDTDRYQDMRIKRLKKDLGCQGLAVYDYILCEVYRVRGCFLEWDENTAFDVADYFGLKESVVTEIVKYCGAVGLFNKELLTRGIITSASIQKRYLNMCNRAKRSDINIPEVCRIIPEVCDILPEESPILPEVCDKVKKSKEKKNKRNSLYIYPSFQSGDAESSSAEPTQREREDFFKIFFFKNYKNPAEQVEKFVNHYAANGWMRNNGTKIADRTALARTWEVKDEAKKNRFPHPFIEFWQELYDQISGAGASDDDLRCLLYDIQRVREQPDELQVYATRRLLEVLKRYANIGAACKAKYYSHNPNIELRIYATS